MLITTEISKSDRTVTWRLDGNVVGMWVSDLEKFCLNYRDEKNKTVVLDFSGVTFIDNKGVRCGLL